MCNSLIENALNTRARSVWLPWLVCLSAGLFFFYEFFQLNAFDVINEPLRADFQVDATTLSWMSSTYVWANVLFLLPAGFLLDRYSVRSVILTAMLVCVLGTLGFALTHHVLLAGFYHALAGVGNAFCFLSCVVLVSRWFPPRRQALVIGCIVTMAFLGGMMAHTPLVYLTAHYGWRQALCVDAAIGVLILLWIYFVVQDKPVVSARVQSQSVSWMTSLRHALLNPQNSLAGLYTACLNLPIMVLCALWGSSYLQTVHHLTAIAASNSVSLIFVGSMVGCPLAGWLSDHQGRRKPIMMLGAGLTLLLFVPLLIPMPLTQSLLSGLFFLIGLFTSTQVIAYPLVAESNPAHQVGLATGLASVIIMGGGGFGQILFGMLLQQHAGQVAITYGASDYHVAIWLFPISLLIALVVIFMTKETNCTSLKGQE